MKLFGISVLIDRSEGMIYPEPMLPTKIIPSSQKITWSDNSKGISAAKYSKPVTSVNIKPIAFRPGNLSSGKPAGFTRAVITVPYQTRKKRDIHVINEQWAQMMPLCPEKEAGKVKFNEKVTTHTISRIQDLLEEFDEKNQDLLDWAIQEIKVNPSKVDPLEEWLRLPKAPPTEYSFDSLIGCPTPPSRSPSPLNEHCQPWSHPTHYNAFSTCDPLKELDELLQPTPLLPSPSPSPPFWSGVWKKLKSKIFNK